MMNMFMRKNKKKEDARDFSAYKLFAFDIDGTIAESKMPLDDEMDSLLCGLLHTHDVALVSGASYEQMSTQIVSRLSCREQFSRLWLIPVSGSLLYRFVEGTWSCLDSHNFSEQEKKEIMDAFEEVFVEIGYEQPTQHYGDIFEDREAQITFSALGQQAPISEKMKWNKVSDIRPVITDSLRKKLPLYEVRTGGMTTIDITPKGIDKAFAIKNLSRFSGITIEDMLYIGDALYPGGNDEAVIKSGVRTFPVKDLSDTKDLLRSILNNTDKREK